MGLGVILLVPILVEEDGEAGELLEAPRRPCVTLGHHYVYQLILDLIRELLQHLVGGGYLVGSFLNGARVVGNLMVLLGGRSALELPMSLQLLLHHLKVAVIGPFGTQMRSHGVHGTGECSPSRILIDKSHLRGDALQMLERGCPRPNISKVLDGSGTTILRGKVRIKLGLTRGVHLPPLLRVVVSGL